MSDAPQAAGSTPIESAAPVTVAVIGASLLTGNLGVSALGTTAVKGILQAFPDAMILYQGPANVPNMRIALADRIVEAETLTVLPGGGLLRGRYAARRLRRLARLVRARRRWGRWIASGNKTIKQLLRVDAVLDVSAGDSFTDIYGHSASGFQTDVKLLMHELSVPLVLLPQTYGPFLSEQSRERARQIVGGCRLVATREEQGIEELRELCGGELAVPVARCPDMAFLLDPVQLPLEREPFLRRRDVDDTVIGLNVSGLLLLAKRDFGLASSYEQLTTGLIEHLLARDNTRVLLVPHVIARSLSINPRKLDDSQDVSDTAACTKLMQELGPRFGPRLGCLGWPYGPGETKYFIGHCDFFVGSRMHACIAALSQTVPTVTLAYSKKAHGVMAEIGMDNTVIDLRTVNIENCIERIVQLFQQRAATKERLREVLPNVCSSVEMFFKRDLRRAIESCRRA